MPWSLTNVASRSPPFYLQVLLLFPLLPFPLIVTVIGACAYVFSRRYLISGDANGDVFAWRLDRAGWYQILRKFKRNPPPNSVANPLFNAQTAMLEHFDNGSVLTMMTHPNKNKSMLLVHSRQPATLKVISLTTYKPISYCEGYTGIPQSYLVREDNQIFSAGIFFKAMFSADGRYTISCNAQQGASTMDARHSSSPEMGSYRLLVWDTYTGHLVQTPLSST